jgi:7,8-dihydropterin-6-yl-methyl-4-(beta-D-ribofuranosyl)aminobenzene 5'-phosphate synthase
MITEIKGFGETSDVAITVLVDNRADLLVRSSAAVKYFTDELLLAEHGFAALVDLRAAGTRILWDAGGTRIALMENLRRLEIDPATITAMALSHGHFDHTAAVTEVLRAMDLRPRSKKWEPGAPMDEMRRWAEGRRVPLITHLSAFRERWHLSRDGSRRGPTPPPPRAEWEALGAQVITTEGPYELGPGCWTTGPVPRASFEKSGISPSMIYRDGDAFHRDTVEEDQAIVINVQDKGLVILAGCAHSGIVNTVNRALELSGVRRVWAIVGGFHLASVTDEELQRTIEALKAFQPALIVPSHCTGFRATWQLAAQMPEAFMPNVVGAKYLF